MAASFPLIRTGLGVERRRRVFVKAILVPEHGAGITLAIDTAEVLCVVSRRERGGRAALVGRT